MKKTIVALGILLCAVACQNQEPSYIPAEQIEHYYIDKSSYEGRAIFYMHIDPNCKEDLYECPGWLLTIKEHWALCSECIHPDTAKEIQKLK